MSRIDDPDVKQLWAQNREIINLVVGAILGAYLGLSISRDGISNGTYFDLFMLIVLTAMSATQLISSGNRWFGGRKLFSTFLLASFVLTAIGSTFPAINLGLETSIFATIYAAWGFLVVAQIAVYEWAKRQKRSATND